MMKMSSADEEAREIARAREESRWAWKHTLYHTEERAREGGEQAGKIEMVKSLLALGVSSEIIADASGLSLAEIGALQRNQNI